MYLWCIFELILFLLSIKKVEAKIIIDFEPFLTSELQILSINSKLLSKSLRFFALFTPAK